MVRPDDITLSPPVVLPTVSPFPGLHTPTFYEEPHSLVECDLIPTGDCRASELAWVRSCFCDPGVPLHQLHWARPVPPLSQGGVPLYQEVGWELLGPCKG